MAALITAFNALDFDPSQGAGALPVGKHPVVVTESEVKGTKANDGGLLELTLQIIDGPQKGTTGAYRLNLYNASDKAKEIAQRQLSALCHVIGVFQVNDSRQLHNIPFIIEVGMQKGEEAVAKGYTEIKKVFDMQGNEPGKAPAGGAQAQPQQQQQQGGFAQQQQAPAQQPPAGAWGGQQPPAGAWGGQQQAQPAQQQAQGGAWAGGQPAQQQQAAPAANAWGQGQPAQQQQAPAQQQQAAGGWSQGGAAGGAAPWGK